MRQLTYFLLLALVTHTFTRVVHRRRDFRCSHLVVFGDSLSDDGVEATQNSHGFTRNSNGMVWPEYVNDMLQCDQYSNYAYSGAKSGFDNFYFEGWSGVSWQVQKYLENNPHIGDEPLIILQTGGVIDFFTGVKDVTTVVSNTHAAIANITEAMSSGTLLVLTVLDMSSSPGVRAAEDSKELQMNLGKLAVDANRQLTHLVLDSELGARKLHPAIKIRLLNINSVVMNAMHSLNTSEPFTYHNTDTKLRSIYQYAYHDLWNPSTMVHYQLAKDIVRQLQDL